MKFKILIFLVISTVNLGGLGHPGKARLIQPETSNKFKMKFVGEIKEFSYIKMVLESTEDSKTYKSPSIQLKGNYYEAISSQVFKIIGAYNNETLIWKLDCFDKNNLLTSVFVGKANYEGVLEGKWTHKKMDYNFYLKPDK
ncbi:MAG TPA: hypothetical protein VGB63_17895 [Pedobacter sp.]|jgi:hypothetical protein